MGLRFEAWTHPTSGTHEKLFDIPQALPGSSGVRELSNWGDESLYVPASFADAIDGLWIKVFKGPYLIDEFAVERLNEAAGRPNIRTATGPQRNGLVEGIGIAPKDYPNHKAGALDWKWGAENILPDLSLGALGSIREEWEVTLLGERYQLDLSSATAGTFTLTANSDTTDPIDWDASASGIKSAIESLSGITEMVVEETDEDSRAFWIVFISPNGLASDMTANFGSLTGGGTLTKFNDGFLTPATFTITVDGQTTDPLDWDSTADQVEGSATDGSGLQGLSTVQDVSVSGSGLFGDPWVITFYDPPDPGSFSVTFAAGVHVADQTVGGAADPTPVTKSKPIDAGTGSEEEHGDYGTPAIVVATAPLDTGASWTLQVNAEARYAGSQVVITVTPGQTYSNITVPVYPEQAGKYVLTLKDIYDNRLAQTTPRDVQLSADSYQELTIPTWTAPPGVNQVIVRVAVTDANPANIGIHYTSWETATFLEGDPEAPFTQIVRELLEASQDRGTGTFLELDATDEEDTLGTTLTPISFTQFVGDNYNLSHTLDEGKRLKFQWRIEAAENAQVITPAGTTTHVLQLFYVSADEIEDLTASPDAPSVLVGSGVRDAQVVTRRPAFTVAIGLGAGTLSVEEDRSSSYGNVRIERVFDVEHLATEAAVTEYLEARFDEQDQNLQAASATVLESAPRLPGVDFGEGSKIWWQFPGLLDKEARPVKRFSWVHGKVAEFQLQGSRILTGEAAMAAALDMFLREPRRRRSEKKAPSPTSLTGGGGAQTGAHIHLMRATTQSLAAGSGVALTWTLLNSAHPARNFEMPSLPASAIEVREAGYYDIEVGFAFSAYLGGGSVWITRTRAGVETVVWPPMVDADIWTATNSRKFAGVAKGVECLTNDEITIYVQHNGAGAVDLAWAHASLEMVDRVSGRADWELFFSASDQYGLTHDGTNWWTTSHLDDVNPALFRRDNNGVVLNSYAGYDNDPGVERNRSIVYAEGSIWGVGSQEQVSEVDPSNGSVLDRWDTNTTESLNHHRGIGYDGSRLFVVQAADDLIEEYTLAGAHQANYNFPSGHRPVDLTWDGARWWASTEDGNVIRMDTSFNIDLVLPGPPTSGIISSHVIESQLAGVHYRNGAIYVMASNGVYRKVV